MITNELKERILAAITADRPNYPSDSKHAGSMGLSPAIYSTLKSGLTDRVLSDAGWVGLARRLGVALRKEMEWKPASTDTFQYITAQLKACQESGLSAILCDEPNIGKTFTARLYVRSHKNAVYIDCSQAKSRRRMIKRIAKEFGVSSNGKFQDIYDDLVYYLRSIESPIVILDEAGDLQYDAFLELKALWNATERMCGWYMMGADGLKEKIDRSIDHKKVGYTEMFSRYGGKYSKVTPDDGKERDKFLLRQASAVAKANAPEGMDVNQIVRLSAGGLRRIYTEIEKLSRV